MIDSNPGRRCIGHRVEHAVGLYPIGSFDVQRVIPLFGGCGAPQGTADEDAAALAPFNREVEPRFGDSLSLDDQSQLADAIEHPQPRLGEMCAAIKANRGSDRGTQSPSLRIGEAVYP